MADGKPLLHVSNHNHSDTNGSQHDRYSSQDLAGYNSRYYSSYLDGGLFQSIYCLCVESKKVEKVASNTNDLVCVQVRFQKTRAAS